MTIAQRRHGVTAIEVQHLAAIGLVQEHATRVRDLQRKLGVDRREMIGRCVGSGSWLRHRSLVALNALVQAPISCSSSPAGGRRRRAGGFVQVEHVDSTIASRRRRRPSPDCRWRTSRRRNPHWPPRSGTRSCWPRRLLHEASRRRHERKSCLRRNPSAPRAAPGVLIGFTWPSPARLHECRARTDQNAERS